MNKPEVIMIDTNKIEESLVQFSDIYELDKKLMVTVPRDYNAFIFVDGKNVHAISQCSKKHIVEILGKEYLGREIQVAYFSKDYVAEILYGFGGINVNNERLQEAYRVGINGQMMIKINNYSNLLKNFSNDKGITIEDIRDRILPVIKQNGIPVVGKCFANTNVSVFEIDSMLDSIREEMLNALKKDPGIKSLGIEIQSLAINGIHVPDEDLEMIRDRINN